MEIYLFAAYARLLPEGGKRDLKKIDQRTKFEFLLNFHE